MNLANIIITLILLSLGLFVFVNAWIAEIFKKGKILYISNKFPVKGLVGASVIVKTKIEGAVFTKIVDKSYFKVLDEQSDIFDFNEINISPVYNYSGTRSLVGGAEVRHYDLKLDYRYLKTTPPKESKQIKNKSKGTMKMSRVHRFLLQTALVYLVWKAVLNVEEIINYLVTLIY